MCMHKKFSLCFLFRISNKAHSTLPIYSNIYIWMEGRQYNHSHILLLGPTQTFYHSSSLLGTFQAIPCWSNLRHLGVRSRAGHNLSLPHLSRQVLYLTPLTFYKRPSPSMCLVVSCHFESIRCCFFCQDRFSSCLFYPLITASWYNTEHCWSVSLCSILGKICSLVLVSVLMIDAHCCMVLSILVFIFAFVLNPVFLVRMLGHKMPDIY